jgi:two-component system cell cycle sensor histidine kinase/response regulator CckA
MSDGPATTALDRSDRSGSVGLVLTLAGLLVGASLATLFIASDKAQTFVIGLLAFLSVVGVFSLLAGAVGLLQFGGRPARNDLTKTIADTSPDALMVTDGDGSVIYANEAFMALSGGGAAQDARPVERLFSGAPEVSEAVYRLVQAAREGRRAGEELRVSPPLGQEEGVAWYRVRVRPLRRGTGRNATLWSVTDISRDRDRQENVFQELQQAIDHLDHAPAGFLSIDPSGAILYMNATLATWLDHDLAQVGTGGLDVGEIVAGDAAALLMAGHGAPGEVRTDVVDIDLKTRSGRRLPVHVMHRVAFGQDGRPGPSRSLVLEQGPAGDEAAQGQRAAEMRFARLFNDTPIAIATLDSGGRLVRTNASYARMFGPAATGAGEAAGLETRLIPASRPPFSEAMAAVLAGRGEIAPIDVALGDGRAARLFLSAVSGAEDGQEVAILYALDTTEQRNLEEQFAQAQKMQAVGQLAGGVAHDFNNVLQAIMGYSDLLLANHRPTDPAFQDIIQIKQNANRAKNLVQHLLAFSRKQTLRPQILNLGETLADLSTLVKRLLGERVTLDIRHGRDLWDVFADSTQFEQAVINLCVNARDAMPEGGKVTIRTRNVGEGDCADFRYKGFVPADYVLIEVEDTGTGISPENIEKIFEPFFTTKDIGKGTGLGLSMVYGFVKQTGGFIYCESEPGHGASFRIFLPRHVPGVQGHPAEAPAVVAVAQAPAAAPPQAAASADHTGSGVVLLVEDEEAVRAFGARALASRGYEVLQAASGREALDIFDSTDRRIDLVVSDVVMPEMDGPTLLRELRKRNSKVKFVFVSGYAEDAFARNLPEGESFAFLPKPFQLKQLIETVKAQFG